VNLITGPDVDNLSIDSFVLDSSFVVHFTPTCPGAFTYNLLNGGSVVDFNVEPNDVVMFAVQPCTTYSTFTLQPVALDGTDAGTAIPVPTVKSPDGECFCFLLCLIFWNKFLVKFLSSMVLVIVQNLLFDLTERRFLQ
jgi:hypothetical protein